MYGEEKKKTRFVDIEKEGERALNHSIKTGQKKYWSL